MPRESRCWYCGQPFLASHGKRYCRPRCWYDAQLTNTLARKLADRERECLRCKRLFVPPQSNGRPGGFCSQECRLAMRAVRWRMKYGTRP